MTKEDKDLLLKDLCARLPYGVKLHCISNIMTCIGPYTLDTIVLDRFCNENTEYVPFDEIKPYLLPLSSMSEEQRKELADTLVDLSLKSLSDEVSSEVIATYEIDFYNKNHFDYRGLINKGLAIDATNLNIYGKRI